MINLLAEHNHKTNNHKNNDENKVGQVAEGFPKLEDGGEGGKTQALGINGLGNTEIQTLVEL